VYDGIKIAVGPIVRKMTLLKSTSGEMAPLKSTSGEMLADRDQQIDDGLIIIQNCTPEKQSILMLLSTPSGTCL